MKKVKLYKAGRTMRIQIPKKMQKILEPGDVDLGVEHYVFPTFISNSYSIFFSKPMERKLELEKYDHVYIEYDEIYDLIEVHLNKPHNFMPEGTI